MDKDYYKEHRKNSFTQWAYSIQRIDLLIVSISGAGVYVCLESLKYTLDHHVNNAILLKICGLIFITALVLNFISQYTGEKANHYEMKFADGKLDDDETEAATNAGHAECLSNTTGILNIASMITMFCGLSILIIYFWITF